MGSRVRGWKEDELGEEMKILTFIGSSLCEKQTVFVQPNLGLILKIWARYLIL